MQEKNHVDRIVDRLRREMERQRLSPMELSRRAQVGRSFIYDMLNGKASNPTAKKIRALADALDVSVPYLTEGNCGAADMRGRNDYVAFDALNCGLEEPSAQYFLPKDFIAGKKTAGAAPCPSAMCLFFMQSDEMEPTIARDDILLIERTRPSAFSAGVYALQCEKNISIRRLERFYSQGKANYYVHPDNRNYRSYSAPEHEVQVIGRVIKRCGAL